MWISSVEERERCMEMEMERRHTSLVGFQAQVAGHVGLHGAAIADVEVDVVVWLRETHDLHSGLEIVVTVMDIPSSIA